MSGNRQGLEIGVIGAGPVARVLAAGLAGAGHLILGMHALPADDKDATEALLPSVPFLDTEKIITTANLVLIAVSDDDLEPLISDLSERKLWQNGQLVMHTSAKHGTEVLKPAVEQGVIPFAMHPAFEFSGTSLDLSRLQSAWCAVTAPVHMLPIAQALVIELGAQPVIILEEDRPKYAEAIQTAEQFSAALVNQAKALLADIGVERPGAVLDQVFRSALDKALTDIVRDPTQMYGLEQPLDWEENHE